MRITHKRRAVNWKRKTNARSRRDLNTSILGFCPFDKILFDSSTQWHLHHFLHNTGGRLWGVHIHAANQADTKAGCVLADRVLPGLPSVTALCADAGYRGTFVEHLQTRWQKAVHISTKIKDGFAVIPKRWVAERSFGWFNGHRRLSKDYEKKTAHAEAMLLIAAFTRTLRALAF